MEVVQEIRRLVVPGFPSTTRSNNMCGKPLTIVDYEAFEKTLTTVISSARSLAEIEVWLKSQHCEKSVHLGNYLLNQTHHSVT
jgi:hypothetical protein